MANIIYMLVFYFAEFILYDNISTYLFCKKILWIIQSQVNLILNQLILM